MKYLSEHSGPAGIIVEIAVMCSSRNNALYMCFAFRGSAKIYCCYQSILQPSPQPQCDSSHCVHNHSADSHTHTHSKICMYVDAGKQPHTITPTYTHVFIVTRRMKNPFLPNHSFFELARCVTTYAVMRS